MVQSLLDLGADVRGGQNMALRVAAWWGHLNLVEFLLRSGASPDTQVPVSRYEILRWIMRNRVGGGAALVDDESGVQLQAVDFEDLIQIAQLQETTAFENVMIDTGPTAFNPSNTNQTALSLVPGNQNDAAVSALPVATNPTNPPQQPQTQQPPTFLFPSTLVPPPPIPLAGPNDAGQQPVTANSASMLNRSRKSPLKISLLLQAVNANHLPLARLLVQKRTIPVPKKINQLYPNLSGLVTQTMADNNSQPEDSQQHQSFTIGGENVEITRAGHMVSKISMATKRAALREAFRAQKFEMCRLLIEEGGTVPTRDMVHELLIRAGTWRLTLGLRERLTNFLVMAIKHLGENDFHVMQSICVRSASEIGSPHVLRVCVERSADVNIWDGLPLYASVYNGNLEVTKYLLSDDVHAETTHFNWKQRGFCLGLIVIEGFAMVMFSMLVGIWFVGMVQTVRSVVLGNVAVESGQDVVTAGMGTDGVTVGELTGMAVPSAIALGIMYRLVPFHRMVQAYILVLKEDAHRRRAREARLASEMSNVMVI